MARWYSFNDQMHDMFGGKVYRLSLSSHCTCPNRDGTLSKGGCIFCSAKGSGEFAANPSKDIASQIEEAKERVNNKIGRNSNFAGYMAYFQSFTNTYGDTDSLACLFEKALSFPEIVSLSVATRPDCLKDDMVERLAALNSFKPVFVELGLQTVHEDTAAYINRCFSLDVFEDAFARLKAKGLKVVVHVITGLPGENAQRTGETVKYLSGLEYKGEHIDAVKLTLLYVLKGTKLAALLPENKKILYGDCPGNGINKFRNCGLYGAVGKKDFAPQAENAAEFPGCETDLNLKRPAADNSPSGYIVLRDGMFLPQYSLYEYATLTAQLIRILPAGCAVFRVSGDPPKKDLILPKWCADKKRVLNAIRAEF